MPDNPDTRQLPEGWVQDYDEKRQRWFYKEISRNPPRISYAHPLGTLTASQVQRTSPILTTRDEPPRAQSVPQAPATTESERASYAQQLYRHASVPMASVTPSVPPPPTQGQLNLPAHMRQILSDPPPPSRGLTEPAMAPPTPTSPVRSPAGSEREGFPSKRMSLGYAAPSSRPSSTSISASASGSGTRSHFIALQLPSQPQTLSPYDPSKVATTPLSDYGSTPLPPLPGQSVAPQAMQPSPPLSPLRERPISYSQPPPAAFTTPASRAAYSPTSYDLPPSSQPAYSPTSYNLPASSTSYSQGLPASRPAASPPPLPPNVQRIMQRHSAKTYSTAPTARFVAPPLPLVQVQVQAAPQERGFHPHVQQNHHLPHQQPQHAQPHQQPHQSPPPPHSPPHPYQPTQYQPTQYQPTQSQPTQPTQYQPTQYQPTQYQPTQHEPAQSAQYQPTQYQPTQYQSPQPTPHSPPPHQASPPAAQSSGPGLMTVLKTGYHIVQKINDVVGSNSSAGNPLATNNSSGGINNATMFNVNGNTGSGNDLTVVYNQYDTSDGTYTSGTYDGGGSGGDTSSGFDLSSVLSAFTGGGSGSGNSGSDGTGNTDGLNAMLSGLNLGQSDVFQSGDGSGGYDASVYDLSAGNF